MTEQSTDLQPRTLAVYRELKALLERDDLPPGVRANVEQALSAMWQAANNLGAEYEYLYDVGV